MRVPFNYATPQSILGCTQYTVQPALISGILASLLFIWQGHYGFSLWDEGFLWYGTQRTAIGEIPIRDFMAYDPGRYYWSAAIMAASGSTGIVALRIAISLFEAAGLLVGVRAISRASDRSDFAFLVIGALTLAAWMFPRHKIFDISVSLMLVGAIAFLLNDATLKRFFWLGLCIGLAAVFGRNHGVYALAGAVLATGYLLVRERGKLNLVASGFVITIGITIGYLPIIAMCIFTPGFGASFWESVRFLFEIKGTNLALPVPWPWLVPLNAFGTIQGVRQIITGTCFIALLLFGCIGVLWLFWSAKRQRTSPELAAAIVLIPPYAHFAFSRADISHLAQGIFPLMVATLILISWAKPLYRWPAGIILLGISALISAQQDPGFQCRFVQSCVATSVGKDKLTIDPNTAAELGLLKQLDQKFAPNGRNFVALPFWPGAYAVLDRRAPVWETYALFPRSEAFQRTEISQIRAANPGFVVLLDLALDGDDKLRFRNTHPKVNKYIFENFVRLPNMEPSAIYEIFKSKSAS